MSEFSSLENKLHEWKQLQVPTIDVRESVMKQIIGTGNQTKHAKVIKKRWWISGVCIATLGVAIPAGASILPMEWNGMEFSIQQDGGANKRIETFKEWIAGHEDARQWMERGVKQAKQTYSLKESQSAFPFPILRPNFDFLPSVKSIGLRSPVIVNGKTATDQFSYSYWDSYAKGKEWVVVSQMMNQEATDFMNHSSQNYSATYSDGYKEVQINKNSIGFLAKESHDEYLMDVNYWVVSAKKMVELKISGNVTEDRMVQIAKAYLPND